MKRYSSPLLGILLIILTIVLAPFAFIFSVFRLPFAKRRITKLNQIVQSDWLLRKKYLYVSYDEGFPLAKFVEDTLIPKYGDYTIYDKWSSTNNKWSQNEPDLYGRVEAIDLDIASNFDGDPHLLIVILKPKESDFSENMSNLLYFTQGEENTITLKGEPLSTEKAKKLLVEEIEAGLKQWGKVKA